MIEITFELAERAAGAARAKASELKISITVSVVDEAGRLVYCGRGDGTGFLTTETARGKAVAAAAFRRSTKELVELQKTNAPFWNALPSLVPGEILPTTGAVPIVRESRVIGAIGCGGASPEQDHECALAGAAAVS
jgi:glc operon protein GlcG